jgi:hypothetical protein
MHIPTCMTHIISSLNPIISLPLGTGNGHQNPKENSLAETGCDLLSMCSTMLLLLSDASRCRSTQIGALVAPFSPVGYIHKYCLLSTLNFSMDIRRVWAYWSWGRAFWTSKYTLVSSGGASGKFLGGPS